MRLSTSVSALSARMYLRGTSALRHLDRDRSVQERDGRRAGRSDGTERRATVSLEEKRRDFPFVGCRRLVATVSAVVTCVSTCMRGKSGCYRNIK